MDFQTFRWGGGHPDSEIRGGGGGGGLQKIFFGPFGPHFGIKIRRGGEGRRALRAPSVDPPLRYNIFGHFVLHLTTSLHLTLPV